MKYVVFIALIFSSPSLFADIPAVTNDGRKVMLKNDGTWQFVEKNNEASKKSDGLPHSVQDAVEIWDTSLQHWEQDAMKGRYHNSVALAFHYYNKTGQKVIGVVVHCTIRNAFDKVMFDKTFEDEIIVKPGERLRNTTYWIMKDNEFINGQAYDLLKMSALNDTARIKTKILKVVFADGTVIKADE